MEGTLSDAIAILMYYTSRASMTLQPRRQLKESCNMQHHSADVLALLLQQPYTKTSQSNVYDAVSGLSVYQ